MESIDRSEMATFNILDHGAAGDGATNDAAAIQRAVDACAAAGGGTVLVPAGRTFVTSRWPGNRLDLRPGVDGLQPCRVAGVYARHVNGLVLRDMDVVWNPAARDECFGHALECEAVSRLRLDGFRGQAAFPERDAAQRVAEGTGE
jgi:hypothetical protein